MNNEKNPINVATPPTHTSRSTITPPVALQNSKEPKDRKRVLIPIIVLAFLIAVAGVALFLLANNDSGSEYTTNEAQSSENSAALQAEVSGFLYAFGTQPNDDGNNIEGFEPATEEQIQIFTETIATNEEQFDDDEDRQLIELIEYDEWNNEGQISADVIEQFIGETN